MNSKFTFSVFGASDVGRVREHNEDDFRIALDLSANIWKVNSEGIIELNPKGCVLILSDGMGGANAGEIASRLTVEYTKEFFSKVEGVLTDPLEIRKVLKNCCELTQQKLSETIIIDNRLNGMGATLIVAYLSNNGLYLAWIGDSRAYLYSPTGFNTYNEYDPKFRSIKFRLLTDDHSLVWNKVLDSNGQFSPEDARLDPNSNVITRYLGESELSATPDIIGPIYMETDYRLILCSDGLNSMISDQEIELVLEANQQPEITAFALIEAANLNGGHDNTTVVVLDVINGHSGQEIDKFEKSITIMSPQDQQQKDEVDTRKIFKKSVNFKYLIYLLVLSIIAIGLYKKYIYKKDIMNNEINSLPVIIHSDTNKTEPISNNELSIPQKTLKNSNPINLTNPQSENQQIIQHSNYSIDLVHSKEPDTSAYQQNDTVEINSNLEKTKKTFKITPVYSELVISLGSCKPEKTPNSLVVSVLRENGVWYFISHNKDNTFKRRACNEAEILEKIELSSGEYKIRYYLTKDWKKFSNDSIPIVIVNIQKEI
ncbi:MAG: serine/threonine-protein phosphatase [Saprospiraceae bacterium]|nr:serine/threonine-protein phosphatase [Saprospiraceae bacterium]